MSFGFCGTVLRLLLLLFLMGFCVHYMKIHSKLSMQVIAAYQLCLWLRNNMHTLEWECEFESECESVSVSVNVVRMCLCSHTPFLSITITTIVIIMYLGARHICIAL